MVPSASAGSTGAVRGNGTGFSGSSADNVFSGPARRANRRLARSPSRKWAKLTRTIILPGVCSFGGKKDVHPEAPAVGNEDFLFRGKVEERESRSGVDLSSRMRCGNMGKLVGYRGDNGGGPRGSSAGWDPHQVRRGVVRGGRLAIVVNFRGGANKGPNSRWARSARADLARRVKAARHVE
jgi:hypothetical protein